MNSEQPIQDSSILTNPEQAINCLRQLQGDLCHDKSLNAALETQIQIITMMCATEPTILLTPFDTMLQCLHDAKMEATTPDLQIENSKLVKQFQLMLQNYVFFMDASLKLKEDEHSEAGWNLVEESLDIFEKSVTEIATICSSKASKWQKFFAPGKVAFKNVFKSPDGGIKSYAKRIFNWYKDDSMLIKKRAEYYDSLYLLFEKLGRYPQLVGNSILLPEMIRNHAEAISKWRTKEDTKLVEEKSKDLGYKDTRDDAFSVIAGGVLLIGAIGIFIIRCIYEFFSGIGSFFSDLFSSESTPDEPWFWSHVIWTCVFCLIGAFMIIWGREKAQEQTNIGRSSLLNDTEVIKNNQAEIKQKLEEIAKKLEVFYM